MARACSSYLAIIRAITSTDSFGKTVRGSQGDSRAGRRGTLPVCGSSHLYDTYTGDGAAVVKKLELRLLGVNLESQSLLSLMGSAS